MQLTPEEAQNSELLRNLAAQQAVQMQQAQLYAQKQQQYAYGWVDPTRFDQTNVDFVSITKKDLNKVLWNIKPLTKAQLFLFTGFALLCAGLFIKLVGI